MNADTDISGLKRFGGLVPCWLVLMFVAAGVVAPLQVAAAERNRMLFLRESVEGGGGAGGLGVLRLRSSQTARGTSLRMTAFLTSGEPAAAKVYRITGVAVNGRDGTPIPRARIVVTETERGVRVRTDAGGNGEGGQPGGLVGMAIDGRFGAGGPGGRPGGGPGRGGQEANGSQDPEPVLADARGRFSVVVAHQGTYRVAGSARGFRLQAYEQQEGNFFAGVVLTPAAPEMNLTLKLTGDATLTGIVFDEAGEGVRNAQVRVEQVRPEGPNQGTATRAGQFAQTDDRGRYEISPLAPGKYRVRVTARPWYANGGAGARTFFQGEGASAAAAPSPDPSLDLVYAETWFPAATDPESAETVVLSGGEERQADFHLTPIPSIHLRVPRPQETATDGTEVRRGPGAPMVTRSEPGGGFGYQAMTVTTTANGEWDIGGLSPGTYTVRMGGIGGGGGAQQVSLGGSQTVVSLAAATNSVAVTMTVEGVPERSVRQITLIDPVTRQSFQANGGRRGGRVAEREDDEDDDGDARTVQVPPGRYEVYVSGTQGLFLTGLTAEGTAVKGRTVTVGGPMKMTVHAATGLGQVEGVARMAGRPVVGGLVLLVPAGYGREDNLAPVREDETNTDGSFAVRGVIPGEYILVAIDNGWGVNWRDSVTLMGYLGKGVAVEVKGDGTVRKEVEGVAP